MTKQKKSPTPVCVVRGDCEDTWFRLRATQSLPDPVRSERVIAGPAIVRHRRWPDGGVDVKVWDTADLEGKQALQEALVVAGACNTGEEGTLRICRLCGIEFDSAGRLATNGLCSPDCARLDARRQCLVKVPKDVWLVEGMADGTSDIYSMTAINSPRTYIGTMKPGGWAARVAKVPQLERAVIELVGVLRQQLDGEVCDHSVNICYCGVRRVISAAEELLAK